jgi:thymidylate synthase ThyX
MANSVRNMFGLREQELSDEFAIGVLFEKIYNKGRADIVTLDHVSKLTRAEYMPHFTFAVKLSHSADSQAQRQRMSPATRPLLEYVVSDKPDYIIPSLVRAADAVELYREGMKQIWEKRNELVNKGVERHIANYLLPNAVSIRYNESVDLLNFIQKDTKRECLNAQEEIGKITLEQRQDIEKIHPELKGIFGPPCYIRRDIGVKPFCPEGKRYCGVPVWLGGKYSIDEVMKKRKI